MTRRFESGWNPVREMRVALRAIIPPLLLTLCGFPGNGLAQPPNAFDVRRHGAVGDGVALDTGAINKTIEACAAAGGGTVSFPAGRYLTGSIFLKDNVTLWLDAGATILGVKDLKQYIPKGGGRGGALISGTGVRNVAIVGHGTIDGQHLFNPNGAEHMRGPHALVLNGCQDITLRDFSVKDPGGYAVRMLSCERVNVDGITTTGGWDGVGMIDVKNATVSNCKLLSGDDSLSGNPWENVTVSNCVLSTGCNGFRIGGRNVLINNTLIYGPGVSEHRTSHRRTPMSGFQILSLRSPGKVVGPGPTDNIVLSNLTMLNVRSPLWIADSPDAPYSSDFGVGRIIINGLTVLGAGRTPFYVAGSPAKPAKSIVLNNVRMSFAGGGKESQAQGFTEMSVLQSYGIYMRNVESLELHDVRVDYGEKDLRPALYAENVGTIVLDRFVAQPGASDAPRALGSGIRRLVADGREVGATKVRIRGVEVEPATVYAGEPFQVAVSVENTGGDGLAEVPLWLGQQTATRTAWLKAGEHARVRFVNQIIPEAGEQQARAGDFRKTFTVLAKPLASPVQPPFRTVQSLGKITGRSTARMEQLPGGALYLRAAGDYFTFDWADEYAAIYLEKALPSYGTVVAKLENPDMDKGFYGQVGLMVRNDISKAGQSSAGYVILHASPEEGYSLEWDSDGDGRIDKHTEFQGYTYWPHWLKLERAGNRFSGYYSTDATNWIKVGDADVPGAEERLDAGMFAHGSMEHYWPTGAAGPGNGARFSGFKVGPSPAPAR